MQLVTHLHLRGCRLGWQASHADCHKLTQYLGGLFLGSNDGSHAPGGGSTKPCPLQTFPPPPQHMCVQNDQRDKGIVFFRSWQERSVQDQGISPACPTHVTGAVHTSSDMPCLSRAHLDPEAPVRRPLRACEASSWHPLGAGWASPRRPLGRAQNLHDPWKSTRCTSEGGDSRSISCAVPRFQGIAR